MSADIKFSSGWKVEVLRPAGGRAYADIAHGAEKYVIGIPGQPFEVKVTPRTDICAQHPLIRLSIHVDGRSSGCREHMICAHTSKTFQGFISTVKGKHMTSQFLFGAAQTDTSCISAAPTSSKAGKLTVTAEHIVHVPGKKARSRKPLVLQAAPKSQAVEGKWLTYAISPCSP